MVLLHLFLNTIERKYKRRIKIPAIYIRDEEPFPEMESFIETCKQQCHLDLVTLPCPMKDSLHDYCQNHPDIKAIFMGTRQTDPYSDTLRAFHPCDVTQGWPDVTRILPILPWHYDHVWAFLREEKCLNQPLGWCALYDRGYIFCTLLILCTSSHDNAVLPRWEVCIILCQILHFALSPR